MKCRFCHGKVPPDAATCPHCGWELPPKPVQGKRLMLRDRTNYTPKRKLWIGLLGLAVGVGIFARSLGSGDSTPRFKARDQAAEGLEALMAGRYEFARGRLHIAVRHDDAFAEGWLALGMANLATAHYDEAREASERALALMEQGDLDPQAWRGTMVGRMQADAIARRTLCATAEARARGLDAEAAGGLYEIMFEVFREPDCAGAEAALKRAAGRGPAYEAVLGAMARCPEYWRCARRQ